ncbi:MAG: Arc family DNA-binding protein [Microbacterium sp.]
MAAVTIRNLPDDVVDRLKHRAKDNGRSMEAEARAILSDGVAGESAVEAVVRERVEPRSKRWWITSEELMKAVEEMSPDSTSWAEEYRHRPYDEEPFVDPWERAARRAAS